MKMSLGIFLLIFTCFQACLCQTCSSAYNRLPVNSDMTVTCGPTTIQLSINICPVYYANFLPQELALNGKHNTTECLGVMDNSTDAPSMKFTLKLDANNNICGNFIYITNEAGTGYFSQYSNVQGVSVSGFVDSLPLTEMGLVSYSTNLYYNFSCYYPLQYILNNTQLLTSFGAIAVNNNNGSFLSTLRMRIYMDGNFTTETTMNNFTYGLKNSVYVQVTSNNTMSYNVYLDQCFATPDPVITNVPNNTYSFFIGCNVQNRTTIIMNGQGSNARFSFAAFRFVQHSNQKTSSIYLHCMTRLCMNGQCPKCTGSRKRREANADPEPVMISSGPIYVSQGSDGEFGPNSGGTSHLPENHSRLAVGLFTAAIIRMWP
ncbi:zona pellucida-like domain-containing protein 1 [Leptodactylus fuscus]|uniref:zona pellucida-like domain-containing protein 1 n=1 Tax=Leptodactylus fuscus TaxID=238119 RepID=UPI003F4F0EF0